jgi:HD-like signal output (HDOD) protein
VGRNDIEIKAMCAKLEQKYDVYIANNDEEALNVLQIENINMMFYDLKMIMNIDKNFLLRVKESYPNVIRIILGEEENSLIFKFIQRNICKTCILKPYEEKILLFANKTFQIVEQIEILNILCKVEDFKKLPSPNFIYQKILKLIEDDADVDKITEAIESNTTMSAKLLRIANSSYYGVRTNSVKQAVNFLGMNNIHDLVVSTSIFDVFNDSDVPERLFQPLWQQSFICSKIVKAIYKSIGKKAPEYATLAGLMANIGSVFLLNEFQHRYVGIIQEIKQQSNGALRTLEDLESKEFNFTHSEIGGYLLNWWQFSYPIIESTMYHHDPFNENVIDRELLCIMHIAEHYSSNSIYMSNSVNYLDKCFEYLSIEKRKIEKIIDEL